MNVVAKFYGLVSFTDGSKESFGVYLNEDGTIVCPSQITSKQVIASLYHDQQSALLGGFALVTTLGLTPPTKTDKRIVKSFDYNFSGLIDSHGTIQSWEVLYDPNTGTYITAPLSSTSFAAAVADVPTKVKLQNMLQAVFDGIITLS